MKGLIFLSMLAAGALLSGCAGKPEEVPSEDTETVITSANQSKISVEYFNYNNTQLRVITRQDTSTTAAAKTVQAIAGMFTGGVVTSFSKNDLKGNLVASLPNPVQSYLNPKLIDSLKNEMDRKETRSYDGSIFIYPKNWRLVYKDLAGADKNYQLLLTVSIARLTVSRKYEITCEANDMNSKEFTLEEWKANDYQKVKEISHSIMDSCAQQFSTHVNEFLF